MPPSLKTQLEARLVALLVGEEAGHRPHARQKGSLPTQLLWRGWSALDRRLQRAAGLSFVRRTASSVKTALLVLAFLALPSRRLHLRFFAVFAAALKALAVGAPLAPGFRIFSPLPAAMRSRLAQMFA